MKAHIYNITLEYRTRRAHIEEVHASTVHIHQYFVRSWLWLRSVLDEWYFGWVRILFNDEGLHLVVRCYPANGCRTRNKGHKYSGPSSNSSSTGAMILGPEKSKSPRPDTAQYHQLRRFDYELHLVSVVVT